MKKFYYSVLAASMAAGSVASAEADILTPETALSRVFSSAKATPATRASEKSFALISSVDAPSGPAVYLFSNGNQSMIVSADDAAPALLGFLDEGRADDANHSPAYLYWMEQYALQINFLRENPEAKTASALNTRAETWAEITPMIKTKWDQGAPYNDLCPEVGGQRSVTGCVATAMAQVLNWHQWPEKGIGSYSYTWNNETLSFNYGATTFDWANMTDTYTDSSTEAQKKAVATLMYACGVAADMNYSPTESEAVMEYVPSKLINYFNYDKGVSLLLRELYDAESWAESIYSQLEDFGPVIYCGQSNEGGHCFVCDGYADGYFHINWGWSGLDDGYFLLSILDPGDNQGIGGTTSGYSFSQAAIGNLSKPSADSKPSLLMGMTGGFKIDLGDITSVAKGATVKVVGNCTNFSICEITGRFGLIAEDASGKQYVGQSEATFNDLKPWYYHSYYTCPLPNLPDGEYKLYPAYKLEGGEWQKMPTQTGLVQYYNITVSGRTVKFAEEALASVNISDITVKSKIFTDSPILITGTATNSTALDFSGSVQLMLVDSEDNEIARGYKYLLDTKAESNQEFTYTGELNASDAEKGIPAATYIGFFFDPMTGAVLSSDFEVTVSEKPANTVIAISDLKIVGASDKVDKDNITFSAQVSCSEGYFADYLGVYIFPGQGGTSLAYIKSEPIFVGEGETVTAIFKGSFPGGETNKQYFAGIYYDNDWAAQSQLFTISSSGISTLTDDDAVVAMDVFTTSGALVASSKTGRVDLSTLAPGIYVIRAVTSDGSVKSLRQIIE